MGKVRVATEWSLRGLAVFIAHGARRGTRPDFRGIYVGNNLSVTRSLLGNHYRSGNIDRFLFPDQTTTPSIDGRIITFLVDEKYLK